MSVKINSRKVKEVEHTNGDLMLRSLEKRIVKKGTFLLAKGEKAQEAYHILKGCLRSYAVDDTGKEHIIQFAPEGWYISDMDSFFNGAEAIVCIDAIEDSEVQVFNKAMLREVDKLSRDVIFKQMTVLQNNIIAINKRLILLLSASAEERYRNFRETYPTLAQRVPLKMIASYLGMTPEFLSRLRKKMSRGA